MKSLEHIMHAILCVLLLMKTFSILNRVGTVKRVVVIVSEHPEDDPHVDKQQDVGEVGISQ